SFALLLPHPMRVTSTPLSFFPRPSPPELYTLSLHDALPISSLLLLWRVTRFSSVRHVNTEHGDGGMNRSRLSRQRSAAGHSQERSEEHTSELQSRFDLVCRLLLEKKKQTEQQHSSIQADTLG